MQVATESAFLTVGVAIADFGSECGLKENCFGSYLKRQVLVSRLARRSAGSHGERFPRAVGFAIADFGLPSVD